MGKSNFTKDEQQFIVDNYATMDTYKIAKMFNKTYQQVKNYAIFRKIKKINEDNFTEKEKQFIIENYSKIHNDKLEEILNISKYKIIHFAKQLGLEKETYNYFKEEEKQYILENYNKISNTEIAESIGRTTKQISAFGWNNGLLRDIVRYNVDVKYFEKIDNEHKAYWLGFLYADGCIGEVKRDNYVKSIMLRLTLQTEDKNHLIKFNKDINSDYKIKDSLIKSKYLASTVTITNTEFCKYLINNGCTPRKSLTLTFPRKNIVSKDLVRHFIRGYFDGDGCVSITKRGDCQISFIGTSKFLNSINYIVNKEIGLPKKKLVPDKRSNAISIKWSKKYDVNLWYNYLYKDATVYLDRKYEKFQIFLNN